MVRPRDIGTRAETAAVHVLRERGFPYAERRALRGAQDAGDITGTPGICWEVKGGAAAAGASDGQVARWLDDLAAEARHAAADIGVLVIQRRGIGPANAHRWWAVVTGADVARLGGGRLPRSVPVRLHLADMCEWLTRGGYGTTGEVAS